MFSSTCGYFQSTKHLSDNSLVLMNKFNEKEDLKFVYKGFLIEQMTHDLSPILLCVLARLISMLK